MTRGLQRGVIDPLQVASLLLLAVFFFAGWFALGWRTNASIERLKLDHQTAITEADEASEARLTLAAQRNAEIATLLADAQNRLITTEREKNDALKKLLKLFACS